MVRQELIEWVEKRLGFAFASLTKMIEANNDDELIVLYYENEVKPFQEILFFLEYCAIDTVRINRVEKASYRVFCPNCGHVNFVLYSPSDDRCLTVECFSCKLKTQYYDA